MEQEIISMREIQRNYKRILEEARRKRKPVFLGAHGKAQAVLMDIKDFENMHSAKKRKNRKRDWKELKTEFDYLASQGRQGVNLADFVREDRQSH